MCYEQETDDAGKRGGKRSDDDEWIEPGLKVHYDQEIDENDGEDEPAQQPKVRSAHGLQLALNGHEAAARQGLSIRIYDVRDLAANRSQIAALDGCVDIDHTPNVVVVNHFHLVRAFDRGNIRQNCRMHSG